MKTGVSTSCLYPALTEDSLMELLNLGIDRMEIFFNSPCESNREFASLLLHYVNEHSAHITSCHPCTSGMETFNFFSRYERRFYDSLEDYKRIFEACNLFGCDILVFHGAKKAFNIEPGLYFERFQKLCEEGLKMGVYVCQENVEGFYSGELWFMKELLKNLPDTKTVLDIKQCRRNRLSPFDMLEAMGENLYHVHLSDHNEEKICMLPGKGNFDYDRFFKRLKELKFDRNVIIELYRSNFQKSRELLYAKNYIDEILENI